MRTEILGCIGMCIVASLVALPATAEMYRWVDENGVTVYSQSPRPDGGGETIKVAPGPSAEEAAAGRERMERYLEQRQETRDALEQEAKEREETEAAAAQRKANCRAARGNLERYQTLGRRRIKTPEGEYVYLGEAEVAERIRRAESQVGKYCD